MALQEVAVAVPSLLQQHGRSPEGQAHVSVEHWPRSPAMPSIRRALGDPRALHWLPGRLARGAFGLWRGGAGQRVDADPVFERKKAVLTSQALVLDSPVTCHWPVEDSGASRTS